MAKKDEKAEIGELERINAQLSDSLERCRRILADCQSKLAANGNERDTLEADRRETGRV